MSAGRGRQGRDSFRSRIEYGSHRSQSDHRRTNNSGRGRSRSTGRNYGAGAPGFNGQAPSQAELDNTPEGVRKLIYNKWHGNVTEYPPMLNWQAEYSIAVFCFRQFVNVSTKLS